MSEYIKNKIYKMTKIYDILQVLEEFKEEIYEINRNLIRRRLRDLGRLSEASFCLRHR